MPKVIFHGHSCFTIADGQHTVLTDPWLTGNPLADVPADRLDASAILVSHGHFDHLGDAVAIAKRCQATIIGVAELAGYCAAQGAPAHQMHIGGSYQFSFGRVKLTPAWHGSAVMDEAGNNIYTGTPCGFLLTMGGKTIYFAGDTGLFGDMQLIGERHPLDLALLPIGDNFVMGPEDAVAAVEMLRPGVVIPMHYNTFDLIKQDPQAFKQQVESRNLARVVVLEPGQEYNF